MSRFFVSVSENNEKAPKPVRLGAFQLFFVGMFPIYMNKIPLELYTLGRQKTFAAHGSWLNMTDDFLPLPLFTMPYIIMLINFEERTKKGKERDNK